MEASDPSPCPVCGCILPLAGLERHVNTHLDEDECERDRAFALELAASSSSSDPCLQDHKSWKETSVSCTECDAMIPLEDWAHHNQLHEMQLEEYSKGNESLHIAKKIKTQMYPVSDSLNIQRLIETQKKGNYKPVDVGIMNLLKSCLQSETQGSSCSVIIKHIDHFESTDMEDAGWGCGWRNIQMLSSHLLMYEWAKKVLFGGCCFVPDISSLQQWLEFAWGLGFDEPGAEYFNYKIYGSKEWIGTTECATLFRSFGLRARIIDFSGKDKKDGQMCIDRWLHKEPSSNKDSAKQESYDDSQNTPAHHNAQCDLCGAFPIKGLRFKSKVKYDYDLCSSCMTIEGNHDDYEKIESSANLNIKGREVASDEHVNHDSLVKWVWNYFIGGIEDSAIRSRMEQLQENVAVSGCTPLYFQHQGHSRTVVGMQRRRRYPGTKEETFLLVLDPSCRTVEMENAFRFKKQWAKFIKRGVHTLKKRSYQVCYIEPGIAEGDELEQLKVLRSETCPLKEML